MAVEKQFKELLEKYKNGDLSREELDQLVKIYSENKHLEFILNSDLQDEWKKGQTTPEKQVAPAVKRRLPLRRVAAIAASFLLLVAAVFYLSSEFGEETMLYGTRYGEQSEIELPDGSVVLLNANTQLEWDADWEKEGVRSVKIDGEAFFDVAHLAANTPFVVETDQLKVHVTGTTFNVRERYGYVEVFLNSGSVELRLNNQPTETIPMDPGQEATYDAASEELVINTQKTLSKSASWVEGRFEFENEYLPEILKSFEALYGVSFQITNEELLEKRLDLTLPYSADWDMLKEALEIALSVEFIEDQQQIIVK